MNIQRVEQDRANRVRDRFRRPKLRLILLVLAPCWGCSSYELPLPPPSRPVVSAPDADGVVTVSGAAIEHATVRVENVHTEEATEGKADENGEYEVRLVAAVGDILALSQQQGGKVSPTVEMSVPDEATHSQVVASSGGGGN